MVGEEGKGFYYAMGTFDWSRPVIGAQAVGIEIGPTPSTLNTATTNPASISNSTSTGTGDGTRLSI